MAFNGYNQSFRYSEVTQRMMSFLPSWMKMGTDPNSVGQQFMNAVAGLELEEVQSVIDNLLNNTQLHTADTDEIAWIYKVNYDSDITAATAVTVVGQREDNNGDLVEFSITVCTTLRQFYNADPSADTCIFDFENKTLYTRREYEYIKINDIDLGAEILHHVWNVFDELGVRFGLLRFNAESNSDFKKRIANVFKYKGDSTKVGLTRWLAGQLGLVNSTQWLATSPTVTISDVIPETVRVGNEFIVEGQYSTANGAITISPKVPIYPREEFIKFSGTTVTTSGISLSSNAVVGSASTGVIFPTTLDYWNTLELTYNIPSGSSIKYAIKGVHGDTIKQGMVGSASIDISVNPLDDSALDYPLVIEFVFSRVSLDDESPSISSAYLTYQHKDNSVTYVKDSDISLDTLFDEEFKAGMFNADGSPTQEMEGWVKELSDVAPVLWDKFKWDEAYWDIISKELIGLDVLPNRVDADLSSVATKYKQVGVGDNNDLLVKKAADGSWKFDIMSGVYFIGNDLDEVYVYASPVAMPAVTGPVDHVDLTISPTYGAPIYVLATTTDASHEDVVLTQVSFLDNNLKATITNTEQSVVRDSKIYVAYNNLEIGSVVINSGAISVDLNAYDSDSNIIPVVGDHDDEEVTVSYQVKNSFTVDHTDAGLTLKFSDTFSNIRVTYESGTTPFYTTSLEVNPIKNHINAGFLYITKTVQPVKTIEVSASPDILKGNGYDRSVITVDVLDENSNPVLGATVTTELSGLSTQGTLTKKDTYLNRTIYQYVAPKDVTGEQVIKFTAGGKNKEIKIWVR